MPRIFHRRAAPAGSAQKVLIASPNYSGTTTAFTSALFNSAQVLERAGINSELCLMQGNADVAGARNELVADFLKTDCTDLVFIDADLYWEADSLVQLIGYDRDVVGGTYPTKDETESRFPISLLAGEQWADKDGLLEVECIATGFLRIRREVLERLADEAVWYETSSGGYGHSVPLIFDFTFSEGRRWGEDFTFCLKWRAAGGKVYCNPEWRFQHYGESMWQDTYGSYLRRRMNVSLRYCLTAIKDGRDTLETYFELHKTWNNGAWAAGPDMLMTVAAMARKGGPIIEFGTGITTLIARAANPETEIVAYEHIPLWAEKVANAIKDAGLPEVNINVTDLVGDPPFYEVKEGKRFDLAICDGPPHREDEDRSLTYPTLSHVLQPGGRFVIDDLHFPGAKDNMEKWAESVGATCQAIAGEKLFGVGALPDEILEAAE